MGGEGSGRRPNFENQVKRNYLQLNTTENIELPNFSGISNHKEAIANFVPYVGANQNVNLTGYQLTASSLLTTLLTVSTMNIQTGSITDTTGAISFGNENLTTTGYIQIDSATAASSGHFSMGTSTIGINRVDTKINVNGEGGINFRTGSESDIVASINTEGDLTCTDLTCTDINASNLNTTSLVTDASTVTIKLTTTPTITISESGGGHPKLASSSGTFEFDGDNCTNMGNATATSLTLSGDNSSADTAYVPMVLYNTDATPPTASNFPIGTIYIQYTA